MSAGVSQIEYWLGTSKDTKSADVNQGADRAVYLSYSVFMGLSILGGFFALDHLYLRSPLTFLAKFIINILFFGVWWLYDATQAVFNDKVVKVYGLGIPSLGPKGIAAGVLANDVPDKQHMRFFIYACILLFTGFLGTDSFILGQNLSGFIRIVCLISIILSPIAIGWWLVNMFKFFVDTRSVVSSNHNFFGAPDPKDNLPSSTEKFISNIPILGALLQPIQKLTGILGDFINGISEFFEQLMSDPSAVLKGPVSELAEYAGPVVDPIAQTAQAALNTVDTVSMAVDDTAIAAKSAINLGKDALDIVEKSAAGVFDIVPKVKSISESATLPAIDKAKQDILQATAATAAAAKTAKTAIQSGGGNQTILAYALMATLITVAVSGFILTYRRSKQNESKPKSEPKQHDDTPPEPGVIRKSDKKESTKTA